MYLTSDKNIKKKEDKSICGNFLEKITTKSHQNYTICLNLSFATTMPIKRRHEQRVVFNKHNKNDSNNK